MSTLDLCERFFGTRDLYQLLELEKDALSKDIKKAYYKLSLQVHPDRVKESEKKFATEKFKVLSSVYQILTDKDKRTLYDEQGIVDDGDDFDCKLNAWLDVWRQLFKPLTTEDICSYEKSYVNSEIERNDIKKAYLSGKGCINHLLNEVPFMKIEDEPRVQKIVGEMIAANEVPEYSIFTNEPAQKRNRRHKKYAREKKEAEEIRASIEAKNNERSVERKAGFNNLLSSLMAKYCPDGDLDDESDIINIKELGKKKKRGTPKKAAKPTAVKKGKIKKRKH